MTRVTFRWRESHPDYPAGLHKRGPGSAPIAVVKPYEAVFDRVEALPSGLLRCEQRMKDGGRTLEYPMAAIVKIERDALVRDDER